MHTALDTARALQAAVTSVQSGEASGVVERFISAGELGLAVIDLLGCAADNEVPLAADLVADVNEFIRTNYSTPDHPDVQEMRESLAKIPVRAAA